MKKLVPLLIALLGLALVIAAFIVWFEPPKEGGVLSVAGGIISFLAGLGASLKGWKDLFKKDEPTKNETSYTAIQSGNGATAQGENPRAVGSQGVMAEEVKGIINYGTIYQAPPSPSPGGRGVRGEGDTLPRLGFFVGRAKELEIIKDAIVPESRTWGALIDGPGGIGKTLAIKALLKQSDGRSRLKRDVSGEDEKSRQRRDLQEALSLSRRAVEIFTRLRHPSLQSAQKTLAEIERAIHE